MLFCLLNTVCSLQSPVTMIRVVLFNQQYVFVVVVSKYVIMFFLFVEHCILLEVVSSYATCGFVCRTQYVRCCRK